MNDKQIEEMKKELLQKYNEDPNMKVEDLLTEALHTWFSDCDEHADGASLGEVTNIQFDRYDLPEFVVIKRSNYFLCYKHGVWNIIDCVI